MERRGFLEQLGKIIAVGAAASVAPGLVFGSQNDISNITTVVNDSNFAKEVSEYKGKAIVLFYSMWEPESAKIFPLFKELVKDYGNKVKFCSYELDESYDKWWSDQRAKDKWEELKRKYNILAVPSTFMYIDGIKNDGVRGSPNEKVTDKIIKKYIIDWIQNH